MERSAALPPLPGAGQNGDDWRTFLLARGVPEARVLRLRDAEATGVGIRAAAAKVAGLVEPGGVAYLIFSGHGAPAPDGKDALLLGADAPLDAAGLVESGIALRHVARLLQAKPKVRPLLILDCALSGKGADGVALVPGLAALGPVAADGPSLGRATVLVGAPGPTAAGRLPGLDRPAFGYLVLGAARGWADQDADERVTAREALDHAAEQLAAAGSPVVPELWGSRTVMLLASGATEQAPAPAPAPAEAGIAVAAAAPATAPRPRCPAGMARIESGPETVATFCIDRLESPGRAGARPTVNVPFELAASGCGKLGRRLCTAAEFSRACAGPGGLDFPYGNRFDPRHCTTATGSGAARAVGAAGERKLCRSGFGVLDLSGNVAEWVAEQVVMGGSGADGGAGARCSSRRTPPPDGRDEWVGYRCCAEPE